MEFTLSDSFIEKYKRRRPPFGFNGLGELVYMRCVERSTPVLCKDLKWREAGDLEIGQEILTFDEKKEPGNHRRYWKHATITDNSIEKDTLYEIKLSNGDILKANKNHPWLAYKNDYLQWVTTEELVPGERGVKKSLPLITKPVRKKETYEAGFISAAFDGEGSLDRSTLIFIQKDNAMMKKVEKYLAMDGFKTNKFEKEPGKQPSSFKSNESVYGLRVLGGTSETLRFMQLYRPPRLLEKFIENLPSQIMRNYSGNRVEVESVKEIGIGEIAMLSTSAATHITAGYPSHNTYSRIKEDGKNERWWETVRRVVEGTYSMQKRWIDHHQLGWNPWQAQRSAQEMYDRIWSMKFLPPGRGLWAMGSPITENKGIYAALNNCGYVTTEDIKHELSKPFTFLMDASMLGVGVGFDTKGAGTMEVKGINKDKESELYIIPDTREGWVESVKLLIDAYLTFSAPVHFDYTNIRPAGEPIKGFGGIASGPEPLVELHINIEKVLDNNTGKPITTRTIVDIQNYIGKCVVAGNVRRTAEIVFGDPKSEEYLDLKNYKKNPDREMFGWTSNNSVFAELGMDYSDVCTRVVDNGEPGFAWLENMQGYSRMKNGMDHKDHRASGGNPSLRAGTKVYTTKGIMDIESLEDKTFQVRNLNGQISDAKCWLSSKKAPLYEIKLKGGHTYYSTPEHKWPIYTPQGYIKAETTELRAGHLLPILKNDNIGLENGLGNYDDGFFIGWLLGDGGIHIRKDNNRRQLNLIVSEKDDENLISVKLLSTLNSLKQQPSKWCVRKGNKELSCSSSEVFSYLDSFGVTDKTQLPRYIWSKWSEEAIKGFIDAMISSDGTVYSNYKSSRIRFDNKNENFVREFSELLGFYGIKNSIFTRERKLNGKCFKSTTLSINDRTSIDHFKSLFNLSVFHKQNELDKITPMTARKLHNNVYEIESVLKTDIEEPVWDISVFDDTHCFNLAHVVTGNCLEQTLESMELCCLVESFPNNHENVDDYLKTLKYAYLYAKTVTLGKTHWPETNRVLLRNRRIGTSVSGIAQFVNTNGIHVFRDWLEKGYDAIQEYDKKYSDWLAVPRSIKTTSVKPSGSVSLLAGATPGLHFPESRFYIRRMRLSKHSELLPRLEEAGYTIEPAFGSEDSTVVVEVPVDVGEGIRTVSEVSMWEQLSIAAFMQKYWADNQVSCTVTFDPEKEGDQIQYALNYFQYQLKGISFLPKVELGAYKQMPYESIDKNTYDKMVSKLKYLSFANVKGEEAEVERFCTTDKCEIV